MRTWQRFSVTSMSICIALSLSSISASAASENLSGKACKSANSTLQDSNVIYKCVKSGTKLIWKVVTPSTTTSKSGPYHPLGFDLVTGQKISGFAFKLAPPGHCNANFVNLQACGRWYVAAEKSCANLEITFSWGPSVSDSIGKEIENFSVSAGLENVIEHDTANPAYRGGPQLWIDNAVCREESAPIQATARSNSPSPTTSAGQMCIFVPSNTNSDLDPWFRTMNSDCMDSVQSLQMCAPMIGPYDLYEGVKNPQLGVSNTTGVLRNGGFPIATNIKSVRSNLCPSPLKPYLVKVTGSILPDSYQFVDSLNNRNVYLTLVVYKK